MVWTVEVIVCDARDLSESASVLLFESRPLLQECCEFLLGISMRSPWRPE